jgi:RNA polymerase sigma-70 factor, ECF subfamily
MKPEAPVLMTAVGANTCADGCATLCTEHGMAAAHAAYHARMLARARRIVVDPDLAEDVVQEAFLRAWRACASFDPAGGPLVNWLLVITANTAIDMVKARVRRPPLASGSADENQSADGINDIDLLILRSELRHALSSIAAHHRDAVVETVLRDRPYADVAAELGVTPGTLRTRVHYGLRRLRCVLETQARPTAAPCLAVRSELGAADHAHRLTGPVPRTPPPDPARLGPAAPLRTVGL